MPFMIFLTFLLETVCKKVFLFGMPLKVLILVYDFNMRVI